MEYKTKIAFPSEHYAETAMRSLGVDPCFADSKTKKSPIKREMSIEVLSDGVAYLCVNFACNKKDLNSMRTCASSFFTNLKLICETMNQFGN
mmetsp:Transcript_39677/g.28670  ORF Transcript_39677/g.28670 Transcript_39677/m.28670 type:complete len:92 (+) Transcript_39677:145-420(+)